MSRNVLHPSDETVQAAITLLSQVPNNWTAVPELSNLEEKGLGLLLAAGMVERRIALRIRGVGDTRIVAVRFRFTGQTGLIQALEPAVAECWELWGKEKTKVYIEAGDGEDEWRLTDQGMQAAQDAASSDIEYLTTFLRTPGVSGVEILGPPMPGKAISRYMPGLHRPVVAGEGRTERVEVVNADAKPLAVNVNNLAEVSAPLADIARILQEGLRRIEKQATEQPVGAVASKGDSSPAKRRGAKPARIWDKNFCPACAATGLEWISFSEFEKRTREEGDAVKRETASARVKDGTYLANAAGRLPWCAVCKGMTPMGTGEREPPVDASSLPSQDQILIYEEQCCACAAKVLKLSKVPSLTTPLETQEGKYTTIARDVARDALIVVVQAHRERGRDLTRDEVEAIAVPEIKRLLEDHWDMEKFAVGDDDDIQNAIAAAKNPRPVGQRGAHHQGEGDDSDWDH